MSWYSFWELVGYSVWSRRGLECTNNLFQIVTNVFVNYSIISFYVLTRNVDRSVYYCLTTVHKVEKEILIRQQYSWQQLFCRGCILLCMKRGLPFPHSLPPFPSPPSPSPKSRLSLSIIKVIAPNHSKSTKSVSRLDPIPISLCTLWEMS